MPIQSSDLKLEIPIMGVFSGFKGVDQLVNWFIPVVLILAQTRKSC